MRSSRVVSDSPNPTCGVPVKPPPSSGSPMPTSPSSRLVSGASPLSARPDAYGIIHKHATVQMAGAAITAVLEWARIAEFRAEGSPVETVRRRLPKRAGGPKHYDALHFSEVGGALARIDATNCAPSTKRAMRFTALTASRQVEVRGATWEQFDLEGAVWAKPAEATKTAKPHRVPLSRQALVVRDAGPPARRGGRGIACSALRPRPARHGRDSRQRDDDPRRGGVRRAGDLRRKARHYRMAPSRNVARPVQCPKGTRGSPVVTGR